MKLSRGVVVLVNWAICVSGSFLCPTNCKANERSAISTCNKETGFCSLGCKSGYYGNNCNMKCDIHCEGKCQQPDGSCKCSPGYTFSEGVCESPKGVTCDSNDTCLNDRCVTSGRTDCLNGCKPGRFGKFCGSICFSKCFCEHESGNCTRCEEGWYGPKCEFPCSQGCKDKICLRNGTCVRGCSTGMYGKGCDLKCATHCVSGCDQLSGDCVQCEAGRYGSTCQSECSVGCTNRGCDRDGRCFGGCSKGYYGERCELTCPKHCVSRCDQRLGDCVQCVAGRYGSTCQSQCSVRCADRGCDRDGRCFGGCSKGYYKEKCTFKCSQQCESEVCHQMTGECTKGCLRGFYGSFCNLSCDDCKGNDCDKTTGECIVLPETWLPYIIGGGVLLIAVVLAVFIACCLIRMRRIMKQGVDTIENTTAVQFAPGPGSQLGSVQIGNTNTSPDDTYNHLFDIKQPEATFCLADDDLETSSGYCAVLPLYRGHAGQSVDESDSGNDVGVMTDFDVWNSREREGVSDDRTSFISLCDVNGDDRQDMNEKAEHFGENNHKPIQIVALRSDVEEPILVPIQIVSSSSDVEEANPEPIQSVSLSSDL